MKPWFAIPSVLLLVSPLAAQLPCAGGEIYDDGASEVSLTTSYGGPDAEYRHVSKFTPPTYPFLYQHVCLEISSVSSPRPFDVIVHNDNGPGGSPGTELARVAVVAPTSATPQWISVDLDCLAINSGSVWIGLGFTDQAPLPFLYPRADTSASHPCYYFVSVQGAWSPQPWAAVMMVRAQGIPGDGVAAATRRLGTAGNPPSYTAGRPVIGRNWPAQVTHSPGALTTSIFFYRLPASGPSVPFGQLLVDLASPRLFVSTRASAGTADAHDQAIPRETALIGLALSSQALVRAPGGMQLCNAYDLVVGCR